MTIDWVELQNMFGDLVSYLIDLNSFDTTLDVASPNKDEINISEGTAIIVAVFEKIPIR